MHSTHSTPECISLPSSYSTLYTATNEPKANIFSNTFINSSQHATHAIRNMQLLTQHIYLQIQKCTFLTYARRHSALRLRWMRWLIIPIVFFHQNVSYTRKHIRNINHLHKTNRTAFWNILFSVFLCVTQKRRPLNCRCRCCAKKNDCSLARISHTTAARMTNAKRFVPQVLLT